MSGELTRQQRRAQQRELGKAGPQLLAGGLPLEPSRPQVLAVALLVKAKLRERDNPTRASEAAEIAQTLADRTLTRVPSKEVIACKRGCSLCCSNFVGVTPPEAFRLAAAVRRAGKGRTPDPWLTIPAVMERAARSAGMTPSARLGAKIPCPLLAEDGACSVYADRPLVCRQAASFSLPPCVDEYEGKGGLVRVPTRFLAASSNAHVVLLAAMQTVGLSLAAYDLSAALRVALADADAERKWLAGEPIFAGLVSHVTRPPEVVGVVLQIAHEIAG